jgi:integral membrane protein
VKNPITFLRKTALVEAVSFLILLGVAMPLKYAWGMPLAVKVAGWIHGLLFMVFCVALVQAIRIARWPWPRSIMVFVAALLPFGPFIVDKRVASYEQEFRKSRTD